MSLGDGDADGSDSDGETSIAASELPPELDEPISSCGISDVANS